MSHLGLEDDYDAYTERIGMDWDDGVVARRLDKISHQCADMLFKHGALRVVHAAGASCPALTRNIYRTHTRGVVNADERVVVLS